MKYKKSWDMDFITKDNVIFYKVPTEEDLNTNDYIDLSLIKPIKYKFSKDNKVEIDENIYDYNVTVYNKDKVVSIN